MDVRVRALALVGAVVWTMAPAAADKKKPDKKAKADKPDEADTPPEEADATPDEPDKSDKPAKTSEPLAPEPAKPAAASVEARADVDKPSRFAWEPFGFLRLQYAAVQNDPNVAFVGRDDGFQLQNARVGVRGKLENRAAFVISIDGAVDEREQINVPEGKLKVGLRDAFADIAFGKLEDSKFLGVRAGFFQSWAEPEVFVADTEREFVDKPIESRGVRATEGFQTQGLTPGRSLGAALRLDAAPEGVPVAPGFELAIQNGADEFASNNDNDKPAVSAAGLMRFKNAGYLVAAARYNPRTAGALPFRQDENDLAGSAGLSIPAGPVAIGGGFVFVHTTFPTTGGPSQNAIGGHAQLTIRVGATVPFAFGYRFGILDPSSLITTDRVMEHTAGMTIAVPRYRMRVQLQATHSQEQGARALSNSRIQTAAEVSL
jgi:hypothetical protein